MTATARTATLIPAGQTAQNLTPGDLIFLHRPGPIRAVIHAGQWIRPSLRPWAALTHVACVRGTLNQPAWGWASPGTLVEAVFPRVRRAHIDEYRPQQYVHVATHLSAEDQAEAAAYLDHVVGEPYGLLTCAGIAVRMLTPGRGGLVLSREGTGICSGIAACMLERGPYVWDGDATAMCPAELAKALGVKPL